MLSFCQAAKVEPGPHRDLEGVFDADSVARSEEVLLKEGAICSDLDNAAEAELLSNTPPGKFRANGDCA
jgi:hypothetical protein